MKKELSLAGLLLVNTHAPALAQEVSSVRAKLNNEAMDGATFAFVSSDLVVLENWIHTADQYYYNDVPHYVTMSFIPLAKDDPRFQKEGIKARGQEFEMVLTYSPIVKGYRTFTNGMSFYAIQEGNRMVVYDCDSTYNCRAGDQERITVFKIEGEKVKKLKQGRKFNLESKVDTFKVIKF